jgi:hypothetical protein
MSIYTIEGLECTEAYIKNLLRLILLKGQECCICNDEQVCSWIVDEACLARGLVVYVRLFCREHEKRWKDAERLEYNKLNGVMLVEMPYNKPAGLWTNMSWSDFLTLLTNYFGNKKAIEEKLMLELVNPCEEFLKKNPKFVLKGAIKDYIKT